MSSRTLILTLALLTIAPAPALAVPPEPKAVVEDHLHNSGGNDWHVQLEVNKKGDRLASVVVYSQKCAETGFTQGVPVAPDGTFEVVEAPLNNKKGTWSVKGQFDTPGKASGTWAVTTTKPCDATGEFVTGSDPTTHILTGNPFQYAPDRIRGTSANARRLRILQRASKTNAARFDTLAESKALGYKLNNVPRCPGMYHSRKRGTAMWGKTLDASAPQSLVYWCDSARNWTLAGYMYRASIKKMPNTFGDLVQWHRHGNRKISTWMTHVWLVPDPVEAFATCVPFNAFKEAGIFSYERYWIGIQVNPPCADTPGSGAAGPPADTGTPADAGPPAGS